MPADFLNADQRASYGQFSGEPNDVQLARFFLLDEADMAFINNRRGRANRLAVALLTGCVRFLGTWPHDLSRYRLTCSGLLHDNWEYLIQAFFLNIPEEKPHCVNTRH